MPEISFKDILMVPDGPPESVWERALDAAYAAPEEDALPDDLGLAEADAPDGDVLASAGNDGGSDTTVIHHDSGGSPDWDEGLGPANGDESHGDDASHSGDPMDSGDHGDDGLAGSGYDTEY